MNILVTGGAGFIGSHIADAYIKLGHNVTILDNLSSGFRENINPKAKFIEMDIRSNEIQSVFAAGNFDMLSHQAAQMNVRVSVDDPRFDADNNIIGSLNLYEQCVKFNVKKVIFASSGGTVYGEQDYFPADEEHPTRPVSPYGISKLTNEKYLFYYKEAKGLDYVALRYGNVYGPRQNPHGEAGVVAIFMNRFLNNEQAVINGDGLITRDYVYIDDVVSANVAVLNPQASGIFNVGTGIETDVNTIFRNIKELSGVEMQEYHGPAKVGEQRRSSCSPKKLYKFNWQPQISFKNGLNETFFYFKEKQDKSRG